MATMSKHFAHKISVDLQDDLAFYRFDMGEALVETTPNGLRLTATASDDQPLGRICDVLESHLLRFAHREQPKPLIWVSDAS